MTRAVCKACGALKFGAWLPCGECGRTTNSLWLSDHYLSEEGLEVASGLIKRGHPVTIKRSCRYFTAKAWMMTLGGPVSVVSVILLLLTRCFAPGH